MAALDSPRSWAVLIGIDYYLNDKCLQGAVRDVEAMQNFLQNHITPIDITMLMSKTPYGTLPIDEYPSSNRLAPLGDMNSWPTETNINASLDRVIEMATPGDLVYVHFSGHGTKRMEQVPSNLSGRPTRLAFVIIEDSGHSDGYYHRENFQDKLRQMASKGLLVTVVLDCCFSGGVLRGDNIYGAETRTVAYDPALDTFPTDTDMLNTGYLATGFRGSRLLPQWPVDFDPLGYTVLAACSPYEEAMEIRFAGTGEKRGALSYFLLQALMAIARSGIQLTHEALYEDLCIRFRQGWPAQTPTRYGNRLMTFFGHLASEASGVFYRGYARKIDSQIYLDAGDAHGISKGDEFEIYPLDSLVLERSAVSRLSPVKAKEVGFLTSQLDYFELVGGLEDGFKAKLITSLSASKTSIRLLESAQVHLGSTRMSDEYQFLKLCKSDEQSEACLFNVGVDSNGAYEIRHASLEKVHGLPTVPLDAHEDLLDVLQHLAQFKYMGAIENRNSDCGLEADSVKIVTSVVGGSAKQTWDDVRMFSLENKGQWGLKITNDTPNTIYVTIFNLTPTWKIFNILSDIGRCPYLELRPRESSSPLILEMEIPDSPGWDAGRCEDIIKVFVTTKRTAFPSMILPDITERGPARRGQNSLSSFLADLTGVSRNHAVGKEGWMTRNILIRTTM